MMVLSRSLSDRTYTKGKAVMRLKLTQERALQLRMQSQRLHPRTDAG